MKKNSKLSALNVKIFLWTLQLEEDKTYSLDAPENSQQQVFIFKDEESLCSFLVNKNIDTSSTKIKDIIKHDLIIKRFEDGTIICSKYLCQYLYQKSQEKINKIQKNNQKKQKKVKSNTNNYY